MRYSHLIGEETKINLSKVKVQKSDGHGLRVLGFRHQIFLTPLSLGFFFLMEDVDCWDWCTRSHWQRETGL